MIVNETRPITLVGAGDVPRGVLDEALSLAPGLVAADGGAAVCMAAGELPDAVIGDLDSIPPDILKRLPKDRVHRIEEQDSTDFDKALRNISAPLVIGVGMTGARVDHHLAAFNVLVRHPQRRCLLLSGEDVVFLCPPVLRLVLEPGARVSLFPLGAVEGASDGLTWPIAGIPFTPDGRIGTSNRAADGHVRIQVTSPKMLVILDRSALRDTVQALLALPPGWP